MMVFLLLAAGVVHFVLGWPSMGFLIHSSKILTIQQGESRYLSI